MFKLLVLLCLAYIASTEAVKCFNACLEDCTGACASICPGFVTNGINHPGYFAVECENPDDLCIYREFSFNNALLATSPVGCLLEYTHNDQQVGGFRFDAFSSIYACEGDFCNVPPGGGRCSPEFAELRAIGQDVTLECALRENESIDILIVNEVRGSTVPDLSLCVFTEFTEFDVNSECFGDVVLQTEPNCTDISELDVVDTNFCPTASPTSSPTNSPITPEPTEAPTSSPTASPIQSPTLSPSLSPIESPTTSPTEETEQPTFSPTQAPIVAETDQPTAAPIAEPTISPTDFVTDTPTEDDEGDDDVGFIEENLEAFISLGILALVTCCFCVFMVKTCSRPKNILESPAPNYLDVSTGTVLGASGGAPITAPITTVVASFEDDEV